MILACGPYLGEVNLWAAGITFLLLKPLAYFAFIQAFRYRVVRTVPMSFRRAAGLALLRSALGVALVGGGMWLFAAVEMLPARSSWLWLYASRLLAWFLVGRVAQLRGRRLVGWTISGTLLNVTFDIAAVMGLLGGWTWVAGIMGLLAVCIATLHLIGRRPSLKARFAVFGICRGCQYDLTGNLSGRCPECGTALPEAA